MEEKIHAKTSLNSKLPTFRGIKSVERLLKTMPNVPNASLVGSSNSSASKNFNKPSGIACMPSVSLTWRKSRRFQQNDQHPNKPPLYFIGKDDAKNPHPQVADDKDVSRVNLKSPSLSSKPTKQTNMLVPPLEDLNPKPLSGLSNSTKFTKGTFLRRTSFSGPNAAKSHVNGLYTNRSTTGLQRPRANSSTNRNSPKESLMQPTASIKSSSCESIVRSHSFSHSIQNSLLPTTSLTRSHSFNRAVDLTRPYQNQPINARTSQRSNLLSRSGRQSEVSNGIEPQMKSGFTRTYAAVSVSGLKKPGLPNGSGIAASFGYRMGRPSLLKSNIPLFTREIVNTKNVTTNSCIMEKTEPSMRTTCKATDKQKDIVETSRQVGDYIVCDNVDKSNTKLKSLNDDVDEISISSLSSSDKNDLSEDFSDDFIDLGSQNQILQVQPVETSPKKEMYNSDASLSFKSLAENKLSHYKTDAWVDLNLSSIQSKNESTEDSYENHQNTPDMNYREGSSLELSPSDSSDGTYMWDEEGMEPIGDIHPCGSYESSEMNSLDILNNIDSCDLEDDDLMLDVDLPEDIPYDNVRSSSMSHFERPDRNVRQQQTALWNRTTHRWSGKEHYHLGNTDHYHHDKNNMNRDPTYLELPADPVESYGMTNLYQASRNTQMSLHENTVMLDEMTLLHMVQDCTAVKTQLLKLKRLMQQNNEAGPQDIHLSMLLSSEPQEAELVYKSQTDDLLLEIKQLKEDAKKKDERIKQLEDLLTTKCKCSTESQDSKGGRRTHFERYTQTPFRRSSHPVLQYSSNTLSSTDHIQGKLIKTALIEDHSKHTDQVLHKSSYHQKQNSINYAESDPSGLSALLSTQLKIKDSEEDMLAMENQKIENNTTESGEKACNKQSDMQLVPSSIQIPTENNTVIKPEVSSAVKCQASRTKTLHLFKSNTKNALVCHIKTCSIPSQDRPVEDNDLQQHLQVPTPSQLQLNVLYLLQEQLLIANELPLQSSANNSSLRQPANSSPPRLQTPAASPPRLQTPAASPPRLQTPAASPPRLQTPAASPRQLQAPAASPRRLQAPAANPPRLQAPAASPPRLQAPAASPPRLQAPAASPPRLPAPAASPPRLPAPAASPRRLPVPAASPPRLPAPAASPPRLPAPAVSPPRLLAPAVSPPRLPAPAVSPPRLPAPAASPPRLPVPAASPPRLPAPATSPPRLPAPATSPPCQKGIQRPKTSSLCPPNTSFSKPKHINCQIPSASICQVPRNLPSKNRTSVTKLQPQKKESMHQSQGNSLHAGEKTSCNQRSRLPKPKTQ